MTTLHRSLFVPLLRRLALASALPLLIATLHAQATGSLQGVITDSKDQSYVQGALVKIEGTSLETTTDRTGYYSFSAVPAGPHAITVSYLGLDSARTNVAITSGQRLTQDVTLTSGTVVLEAFKVESLREGQSKAINQQRASNTIKNIVSSDAIGNLPDRTVGEALGRLPGVNVVDDSKASIRGTAAQYNSVTLDGERFTTAGDSVQSTQTQTDNRAVDLSLIPSEILAGIEVTKALTADMDVDSFGGTINLVTRSAFDVKERTINGKFEYIYNQFGDNHGFAGTVTFMDALNKARTVGVSATLTYREEDRWTNRYEISYYDAGAIPIGNAGSGTLGAIPAVGEEGLEEFDTRLNFDEIKKLGGVLNFDWKLSDTTELHWRTFLENNRTEGGRYRNRARALSRWSPTSTALLESGQQVRFVNLFEEGEREQEVLRYGFDGKTRIGPGTLSYGAKYGTSTLEAANERYIFEFPTNTERRNYSWSLERSDRQLPFFTMTNLANGQDGLFNNLADRRLTSIRFHSGKDEEKDLTTSLDYACTHLIGSRSIDWKFGAKYRGKDRSSRPTIRDFTPIVAPAYSSFTVVAEPRDLLEGRQPTMGPYVSLPEVIARFRANPGAYTAASGDEILALEARKYDVNEDIVAGFAMGSLQLNKLEIIGGVRWEQTETGYHWLADPAGASHGTQRYDDFYPSILLNYRFSSQFVARLAYTNTLSRPSYGSLIPYRVLSDTQAETGNGGLEPGDYPETVKVYLGNADLKAQQSENFDLSLEYYIQPSGVLSVALFRKDLSDIIFRSQFKDPATPNIIYFQERNGSEGKVEGVEVSWQQSLTFLPGFLNGFGVNLNATWVKGSSTLEELVPGTTNTYRPLNVDFLPEQPETIYNAQLWWEKYGFTARVAVNYVDEFVRTSGGRTAFSINNKATRWDASASYRVSKHFTVYVEGKNLTEEVASWFATTPNRPEDYSFPGATFNGGIKFRF